MFAWKIKRLFNVQSPKSVPVNENYSGANRRAINLMPVPFSNEGHEVAPTSTVRYHQLLVSIEGHQRSCCFKVISTKKKSRGALLIFRGRVIGAVYGRKKLSEHLFAQDAHQHAMSDLATAGNILDAYQLPEDLVLASASLFHGQILDFTKSGFSAEQIFQVAVQQIMQFKLPGCVVITNQSNEMLCMVYIAEGKVIGVYSSRDGWVDNSKQSALSYINCNLDTKIMGSILAIRSLDDVALLGFSLTGLSDRHIDHWKKWETMSPGVPSIAAQQFAALENYQPLPVHRNRHQRRIPDMQKRQTHGHMIHPW